MMNEFSSRFREANRLFQKGSLNTKKKSAGFPESAGITPNPKT
jgi:hypothetical protein